MRSPSEIFSYSPAQISFWLGPKTVSKARPYVELITHLEWTNSALRGRVKGTEKTPYKIEVKFYRDGNQVTIESKCSCPVGYGCKHVAALLLANLEHPAMAASEIRAEVVDWLERFRQRITEADVKKAKPAKTIPAIVYALTWSHFDPRHAVQFFKATLDRDGSIRSIGDAWSNVEKALTNPPQFIHEDDLSILRTLWMGRSRASYDGFVLSGENGAAALVRMLATGRLYVLDTNRHAPGVVLRSGPARPGNIQWDPREGDRVQPVIQTQPPSTTQISVEPIWYIDQSSGEAGIVEAPWDARSIAAYLTMPPISRKEAPVVATVLRKIAPTLPAPPMVGMPTMRVLECEPVAVLNLNSLPTYYNPFTHTHTQSSELDYATVHFDYEDFKFDVGETATLVKAASGDLVQVKRRPQVEKNRLAELRSAGLQLIVQAGLFGPHRFPTLMWGIRNADEWQRFMHERLPGLRDKGWRVEMQDTFRFNVIEIDVIDGHVQQAEDGWFDLEMGIVVNDRTVRLEPLLGELFERDRRWLAGDLDKIADDESIDLKTDRGERLRFRAERLKPLMRVLLDLFDGFSGGPLRMSRLDTARLDTLNDTGRWQFHGDDSIRQLAHRLKNGAGVSEVPIPKGLCAELRQYQHQGLSWMQFLREHDLSGILADDMGLGKTIQTLAHLLAEKEANRLDRPALVVVPTTLLHNWREEAKRFTPSLRVLNLHGATRKDRFDRIPEHDLVLTTYALLWRDQEALSAHSYHMLVLDEAQSVKNASSKSAIAIRTLDARHRLCLTGTPMENHLGELWSLFDFLLPGFLGRQKDYTRRWRTPIEKNGDTARRDLLAARIRPFMLRRRKDDVVSELPAKTMIVRRIDLEGAQRDLYETVRTAMQEKVRAAIAAQGLDRSHIIVLDALLKLRQVCCDPRLVKLKQAASIKQSAKLDMLMSLLPELIEEGRRILLFSQFTGMLALIAMAIENAGIGYVELTGDTTDRVTPVRRFQNGEVPLFLISLKAGGVGLNLTAADTVIHYDPWWNPAVENQATDRAHRLGQDKPVFVYKLIAAGSIEEKIVALQEKKAALAAGILSKDSAVAVKFSTADLDALFAPLPD